MPNECLSHQLQRLTRGLAADLLGSLSDRELHVTYVILPKKTDQAAALRKFVTWALTTGQKAGPKLLFDPIPKLVLTRAQAALRGIHT